MREKKMVMGCSSFQTGKEGNMSEEAREACFSSQ